MLDLDLESIKSARGLLASLDSTVIPNMNSVVQFLILKMNIFFQQRKKIGTFRSLQMSLKEEFVPKIGTFVRIARYVPIDASEAEDPYFKEKMSEHIGRIGQVVETKPLTRTEESEPEELLCSSRFMVDLDDNDLYYLEQKVSISSQSFLTEELEVTTEDEYNIYMATLRIEE